MRKRSAYYVPWAALILTLAMAAETEAPAEVLANLDFFLSYDLIKNLEALENAPTKENPPRATDKTPNELEPVHASTSTVRNSTGTVRISTPTLQDLPQERRETP